MVFLRDGAGESGARGSALLSRFFDVILLGAVAVCTFSGAAGAQQDMDALSRALKQAETGHCPDALPVLRGQLPHLQDEQLRYHAAFAVVNCAMSVNDLPAAVNGLVLLRSEFPDDPEVLYAFARIFAQLADTTALELAERFPDSAQVGKLNAQALESKQMWEEAIAAYHRILEKDPKVPGVHFRIAGILLDTTSGAESLEKARKELEAELEINPNNAAAVYVLGEVARRSGDWEEAIRLFSRATTLDAGFLEAYFALGTSLNAASKYAEAIPSLEHYTEGAPDDPAGHYQLALAYSRTGKKEAANRELKLQKEASAKTGPTRPPTSRVQP